MYMRSRCEKKRPIQDIREIQLFGNRKKFISSCLAYIQGQIYKSV